MLKMINVSTLRKTRGELDKEKGDWWEMFYKGEKTGAKWRETKLSVFRSQPRVLSLKLTELLFYQQIFTGSECSSALCVF